MLDQDWYPIAPHWNISYPWICSESYSRNNSLCFYARALIYLMNSVILMSIPSSSHLRFCSTHMNPHLPSLWTLSVLPTLHNWLYCISTLDPPGLLACADFSLIGILAPPFRHINDSFTSLFLFIAPPTTLWSSANFLPYWCFCLIYSLYLLPCLVIYFIAFSFT